jgi:hypothetical protein
MKEPYNQYGWARNECAKKELTKKGVGKGIETMGYSIRTAKYAIGYCS